MLEMRDACERCSVALSLVDAAFVCSFECTYCPNCAVALAMRCPNCGGQLATRPTRSETGLPATDAATNRGYVDAMTFSSSLGMDITIATADLVAGTLAWDESRCTTGGAMHGGALMGFADSLGAILAFLNLPEGALTTTVSSNTAFFRPVTTGVATGITTPTHVGRKFITVQTEVFDDRGKLATRTTQTQAVLTG
jgi:1,4-dihydroxy-2-naphthoyl-CoA hydrolase